MNTPKTSEGYPVTVIHVNSAQKADATVYFSLILGLALGYMLIRGLLSNWKA